MAEGFAALSLVSAILSLVDYGGKVISRMNEFRDNVEGLPQYFIHISVQLPLLVEIAKRLHDQAYNDELPPHTKNVLLPVVEGLYREIQKLDGILLRILPSARASTWEKGIKAVKSVGVQKSVEDFASIIHGYVLHLTAFQATHNGDLIRNLLVLLKNESSENLEQPRTTSPPHRKAVWMVKYDSDDHFVGRDGSMNTIKQQFEEGECRIAITGIGGVGKSRIAIQYCYQHSQQNAGTHVFWVHGASKARFETAYRQIARALDLPGREDAEIDPMQLVCDWLSNEDNGPWLMILDNADDSDLWLGSRNSSLERSSMPLIDFLPRGSHCRILITTRDSQLGYRLAQSKTNLIQVSRLVPEQARTLLRSKLSAEHDLSSADADELTKALEYLPLTITQAAAYLQEIDTTAAEYIELLRTGRSDIPELLMESIDDPGRDRETPNSVFLTWRISFDQLSRQTPRAADMLSLMAMFDRQAISRELLQNPEETPLSFRAAVSKLKAFSLITAEKDSSVYGLHRLVQLSTQRWLEHHGRLSVWQEAAVTAISRQYPTNVEYNVWPLMNDLNSHSQAVLKYTINTKSCQIHRAKILHGLGHYGLEQGHDLTAVNFLLESRILRENHLGLEHEDTLMTMGLLGVAYNKLGRWREAEPVGIRVLEIAKRVLGLKHRFTLKSMSRLAIVYQKKGLLIQCRNLELQVLKLMEAELGSEDPATLTEMINLAFTYFKLKHWREAERIGLQALHLRRQVLGSMHPDTLTAMANLALTYNKQKRWAEAEQLEQQVLDSRMQTLGPDHPRTLRTIAIMAGISSRQKRWVQAKTLQREVLRRRQQIYGAQHPETVRAAAVLEKIEAAEAAQRVKSSKALEASKDSSKDMLHQYDEVPHAPEGSRAQVAYHTRGNTSPPPKPNSTVQ